MRERNGLIGLCVLTTLVVAAPVFGQGEAVETAPETVAASGLHDALFYVFGSVAAICALGVVFSGNIVRTAMWLFGALGSVAVLFFLMLANFLGAIQLIVYAGGILILIVFGVMLTSKSPWMRFDPKPIEVFGGCAVCLTLLGGLVAVLLGTDWTSAAQSRDTVVTVAEFGHALLTDYLLPFEVASVLLLAVMIGAAYLARPEK